MEEMGVCHGRTGKLESSRERWHSSDQKAVAIEQRPFLLIIHLSSPPHGTLERE